MLRPSCNHMGHAWQQRAGIGEVCFRCHIPKNPSTDPLVCDECGTASLTGDNLCNRCRKPVHPMTLSDFKANAHEQLTEVAA